METVNNEFYNSYGERWYTAQDDPVALLRAEAKVKNAWIIERIKEEFPAMDSVYVLDVGCGAGFLANDLSQKGAKVVAVDLSEESLNVARAHDKTQRVHYLCADANHLPFSDHSFDIVCAMDFLEHVEHPETVIKEISRVLKPHGLFFFHTFNRNILSYLLVIKFVELFVKNTPKNMHVLRLFIKPDELKEYCALSNLKIKTIVGVRPLFKSIKLRSLLTGIVPKTLQFKICKGHLISYLGFAKKLV